MVVGKQRKKTDVDQDHFWALQYQPIASILLFQRPGFHSDLQQWVLYPKPNSKPDAIRRRSISNSHQYMYEFSSLRRKIQENNWCMTCQLKPPGSPEEASSISWRKDSISGQMNFIAAECFLRTSKIGEYPSLFLGL